MEAGRLTDRQRSRLMAALAERRDWLAKLRRRMDAVGWVQTDPAYVALVKAHEAVHRVISAVHDAQPPEPASSPKEGRWVRRDESEQG